MNRCSAILSKQLVEGPWGFPETRELHCTQTVGLRTFRDAAGEDRHYCSRQGHEARVRAQALRWDAVRKARHDHEEAARA
jgi:hypothetical protein